MSPHAYTPTQSTQPGGSRWRWLALIVPLLGWGGWYLDRHGGSFHPEVYEPFTSIAQVQAAQPKVNPMDFQVRGRLGYEKNCLPCHLPSGQGSPKVAPPLAGSEWVLTSGPGRLIRITLDGMQGPVTVSGVQYNMVMLPWRDTLRDDAELAAILSYIRSNPDWGHNAPTVKAAQVTAVRRETAGRNRYWTAAELLKIPAEE